MEMEFNLEAFFVSVREGNIAFVISIYSIFLNQCKFTNSCAILNYFFLPSVIAYKYTNSFKKLSSCKTHLRSPRKIPFEVVVR